MGPPGLNGKMSGNRREGVGFLAEAGAITIQTMGPPHPPLIQAFMLAPLLDGE